MTDRRDFLKLAAASTGAAIGLGVMPSAIREALAIPASRVHGSIRDVEHVVILMQENRSFDHYFGSLRGVRGFSDPRPVRLPSGDAVWRQPRAFGPAAAPFHLDSRTTAAQCMASLDHGWKGSHARWKHHDAWIAAKGEMTMGYFKREDLPYYYALADAFTICDAYHCSVFGPTNPNRLFLFTGTSGLAVGQDSVHAVDNPEEESNETADQANDAPHFGGFGWTSYAERLDAAGIDWRVYQEFDNYGDNALAYFARFRNLDPNAPFYRRARQWVADSHAGNAKQTRGEPLVAAFAADVANGTLPQVSWIVAPYIMCEHPSACPAYGESLVARLLAALTARPETFARTVFILNYDENDGFFDHMPPANPPAGTALGKSTVALDGEIYHGEPFGLGPRVPMIVVSPWTRGGFVNSQLFDHTSVIRFLEARFGVREPNITPWRRAVCGDLLSVFDFDNPDNVRPGNFPVADDAMARADKACALLLPHHPDNAGRAVQERGQRPARALPYVLNIAMELSADSNELLVTIENRGRAGATLTLYADGTRAGPWYYTVDADQRIADRIALDSAMRSFSLHGPNGLLHSVPARAPRIAASAHYDAPSDALIVEIANRGPEPATADVAARDYLDAAPRQYSLAPGERRQDRWAIAASDHWYDFEVRAGQAVWRFAGHGETGRPSMSDPALGRG